MLLYCKKNKKETAFHIKVKFVRQPELNLNALEFIIEKEDECIGNYKHWVPDYKLDVTGNKMKQSKENFNLSVETQQAVKN